jgi:hypothetical protein
MNISIHFELLIKIDASVDNAGLDDSALVQATSKYRIDAAQTEQET